MNADRTYRRLFFIRILHGFFLDTNANRYYELSEAKINERLRATIVNGQYTLTDDLFIQPSEETKRILSGHRLIFRVLPHGILLGCAVQDELVNGVIKSKPVVPLSTKLRLQFHIGVKNAFGVYSSTRLDPVIPARYYFTNDNRAAGIVYPSLSIPMKNFIDGRFYQMGETAIVNGMPSQAVFPTTKALAGWTAINLNGVNYVSEYDRELINKKFTYTFRKKGIKEASFELQQNGQLVKTINVKGDSLSEAILDFQKKEDDTLIPDGKYQLNVTGTDNYIWNSELFLSDRLYTPARWAVLDIALHTEDPAFSSLDENGYLTGNDEFTYPTMDLRILNRSTYWRYYFQQKGPTAIDNNWVNSSLPIPPGIDKVIISKDPIPLTKSSRQVKYAADLLPNPSVQRLGTENDDRQGPKICSEILLTKIKL